MGRGGGAFGNNKDALWGCLGAIIYEYGWGQITRGVLVVYVWRWGVIYVIWDGGYKRLCGLYVEGELFITCILFTFIGICIY